jgi:hypothetical protein
LVPAGLTSNNYSITFVPGTYTIVPADELLVQTTNISTTYGSAPAYAITSVQYLNGNDVLITLHQTGVSGSTYSYADGVGGTATFTLGATGPVISGSGKLAVGNYAIGDSSFAATGANFRGTPVIVGELSVDPLGITASAATPPSKTYDGTMSMTGTSIALAGVLSGDRVIGSGIGTFATKDAGSGLSYSLNGLSLTGADAQDYYLTHGVTAVGNNGSITPLALTVSGSSVTPKTYDGTTSATITGGVLNGVLTADQSYVSLATQSGTFASKNAGTGIAVTVADTLTVTGPAAGDYTLTEPTGLTGTISPLALTVSGSSVSPKIYDGTTAATITGGVLNGVLTADQSYVSLATQSGSFASKNVGTGIRVSATDTLAVTGPAAGDYTLTEPTGLTGTITPRAVTLDNETVASKTYDGTTAATLSGGPLTNVVAGDSDGLSLVGTFASPNAGQHIPVTVSLSGADAGNYVLGGAPSLAANIIPAPLKATAKPVVTPLGALLPALTGTFSGFVDGQSLAALEASGYRAAWTSTVSDSSAAGHYAITGSFNDGNYAVVQAAGNATAFDATLAAASISQSSGSVLSSLGSQPGAGGNMATSTVTGGSQASGAAASDAAESDAAASGTVADSAGLVPGAGGTFGGSQGVGSTSAGLDGTNASTGNGASFSLGTQDDSPSGSIDQSSASAIYSFAILPSASDTSATGDAASVAMAGGAMANGAMSYGAVPTSAGVVPGAAGASFGLQGIGSAGADPEGTNASTGNGTGLTLGANAMTTASDGTVTLVGAAGDSAASAGAPGGSNTPAANSAGNAPMGTKSDWRRAFGIPLLVVSGGVNSSLAR